VIQSSIQFFIIFIFREKDIYFKLYWSNYQMGNGFLRHFWQH